MSRLTPLLLFCLALTAGGCAVLGGAGSTADSGMGGVDKAFHDAYYDAQVAKLKGDRAGAKEALLACLDRDPAAAVVHFELARLERQDGQWDAARSAVDKAVAVAVTVIVTVAMIWPLLWVAWKHMATGHGKTRSRAAHPSCEE